MALLDAHATQGAKASMPFALNGRFWLVVTCVPILVYLLGPILIIVPMALTKSQLLMFPPELFSLRPFTELLADERWVSSGVTSFKIAVIATLIASVVGVSSALALHRSRLRFKGLVIAIILLPVMIPTIVLALGNYLFLTRAGLTGHWISISLAHSVMITPYVFVAVQASLAGLDPALPRAVQSLGGGNLSMFRHVYWPAMRPGILGGAVFAFIGSFDEVVVSLFLTGPSITTLPVQMFTSIQYDLSPKIAAVSALLFFLSIVGIAVQALQSGRKSEAPQ